MKSQLSVDYLYPFAQKRLQELSSFYEELQKSMKPKLNSSLRVGKSNGCYQYFEVNLKTGSQGAYIPKSKRRLAVTLAQREYERKLLKTLSEMMNSLKRFLAKYSPDGIEQVFEKMPSGKRALLKPALLPKDSFVNNWLAESFDPLNYTGEKPEFVVSNGIAVRSKSEVMIAESLIRLNVPFKYERPCRVKANLIMYPDFTCLNVRTRTEFLWEHFGLMDDSSYSEKTVRKIQSYESAGYEFGRNLIGTFETKEIPLTPPYVEKLINLYLK